jgi:HAD superfamily hydrolase (TIGR01509 family)
MAIRAAVFDVGSVLEIIDESVFPAPFLQRHGLTRGAFDAVDFGGMPALGQVTEAQVLGAWRVGLGLDETQAEELRADYWRWYVGTLDEELVHWFAGQRPQRRTAILSNSSPGAREAERHWRFETITDTIVYSHEVGLAKPDPRIYALTQQRLDVAPSEILFLDDVVENCDAADALGWHAIVHRHTSTSIREMEATISATS